MLTMKILAPDILIQILNYFGINGEKEIERKGNRKTTKDAN